MMGKVSLRDLKPSERRELEEALWETIRSLRRPKDIVAFLKHLLTESEVVMFGRRIQVAQCLLKGFSHRAARRDLHVGLPTVRSVDAWLARSFRGYRSVLASQYEEACCRAARGEPALPGTFRHLRKRYPLHFLLFNLLLRDV